MPLELIKPKPLPQNGRIAVAAISSPADQARVLQGAEWLRTRGYEVDFAANLFDAHRTYLASPDQTRLREINRIVNDESYDAIFFSRGGYGAMRILDQIDYDAIRRLRRPIVGYSDVTAFHQACAVRAGIVTFHGPMLNFDLSEGLSPFQEQWLFDTLGGEAPLTYHFEPGDVVSHGHTEGIVFGGCLSMTHALLGTPYDFWVDGGIWFWEDVSEPAYRLDRMLTALRLSGRLQTIRGVVVGRLKECGGERPEDVDVLVQEFFGDLGIPVVRNLPFGHFGDNLLLPVGIAATLDTATGQLKFMEPFVDNSAR